MKVGSGAGSSAEAERSRCAFGAGMHEALGAGP